VQHDYSQLYPLLSVSTYGSQSANNARDVPSEWLKNSPFDSCFIPGLILFVIEGGTSLFAAIVVFKKLYYERKTVFVKGLLF